MRQTGILPDTEIAALFEAGALATPRPLDKDQIQPASLDLRLGDKAWRVRASFLPGPNSNVADKLGKKLRVVTPPLFVAMSGSSRSLPLFDSMALLGRSVVRQRLKVAAAVVASMVGAA